MPRMDLAGRTAVITGAAGGIGRAIALSLARRGCHVALADIDGTGARATAARCERLGVRASGHRLDVADRDAILAFPEAVRAQHDAVDLLVNNAGVAVGGSFEQVAERDFDWLFDVNFFGTVRMTRAFLPMLRESDDARIVNLSSIFGIVSPPGQAAYSASKFAVRGFSNALRHELADTQVGVTVVHPGGVRTAIATSARMPEGATAAEQARGRERARRMLKMEPAQAGETIVRGIERRRARILVGSDAKAAALVERLFPTGYWKLLGRAAG